VHEDDFIALTAKTLGVPQADVKILYVSDLAEFADANELVSKSIAPPAAKHPRRRLPASAASAAAAGSKPAVVRQRAPAKYAFKVMPPWEASAGIEVDFELRSEERDVVMAAQKKMMASFTRCDTLPMHPCPCIFAHAPCPRIFAHASLLKRALQFGFTTLGVKATKVYVTNVLTGASDSSCPFGCIGEDHAEEDHAGKGGELGASEVAVNMPEKPLKDAISSKGAKGGEGKNEGKMKDDLEPGELAPWDASPKKKTDEKASIGGEGDEGKINDLADASLDPRAAVLRQVPKKVSIKVTKEPANVEKVEAVPSAVANAAATKAKEGTAAKKKEDKAPGWMSITGLLELLVISSMVTVAAVTFSKTQHAAKIFDMADDAYQGYTKASASEDAYGECDDAELHGVARNDVVYYTDSDAEEDDQPGGKQRRKSKKKGKEVSDGVVRGEAGGGGSDWDAAMLAMDDEV
jgi:hypothetical protein